jgi:long-chain acyl-CoA synthetase
VIELGPSMSSYAQKPWLPLYQIPHTLPEDVTTVIEGFEQSVRRAPESPAIYYFDEVISFALLNASAERFAGQLAAWGIGKGDRVALWIQNDPQFAATQLGAWMRGAIVVPLNPMFKAKELEFHLADSGAAVLVCGEAPPPSIVVDHILTLAAFDALPPSSSDVRVPVSADDTAYLVYTSGTTGNPKGAIILHRNVAFNVEVFRQWMRLGPGDVILGLAPLFHVTGLVPQLAASAMLGLPLVLFHRFNACEAIRLAAKWRATFCVAAITAYIALMNEPGEPQSFVAKCYSGGAPVAPSLSKRFEARFGTYIHNIYGLTESTSPSHATPMGVRGPVDSKSGALSIGVPIPNCEAVILSLEDPGQEAAVGEAGELALRGPMMFSGYWNRPEESAKAFHGEFFRTGDVAIMDELGWFYIVDRKKDMIVASGFKVWPREVEDVLYQHPAVREAAVIGVPDEYRGETVKAYVALREDYASRVTDAEIIHFCKDRMAAYKYPRQVEFVDQIPKTASGKFMRRALRTVTSAHS